MNTRDYMRAGWVLPFLLFCAFVACYYHTFIWLNNKYLFRDSYFSHGYLVAPIVLYLVWRDRAKLVAVRMSGSNAGLTVLVLALSLHIVATMSDVNFLSGFSMWLFIVGSCLYLFGKKMTKQVVFPLCFLILMFPVPNSFIDIVGLPSKSYATSIGLGIIDVVGVPYFREGFLIRLAHTTLMVGTPCNGMRSLISFFAFGSLLLYLEEVSVVRSFIILLALYPLSLVLNGFRIAALVHIAATYGIEYASPDSPVHNATGLIVFALGLLVLFAAVRIMNRDKGSD